MAGHGAELRRRCSQLLARQRDRESLIRPGLTADRSSVGSGCWPPEIIEALAADECASWACSARAMFVVEVSSGFGDGYARACARCLPRRSVRETVAVRHDAPHSPFRRTTSRWLLSIDVVDGVRCYAPHLVSSVVERDDVEVVEEVDWLDEWARRWLEQVAAEQPELRLPADALERWRRLHRPRRHPDGSPRPAPFSAGLLPWMDWVVVHPDDSMDDVERRAVESRGTGIALPPAVYERPVTPAAAPAGVTAATAASRTPAGPAETAVPAAYDEDHGTFAARLRRIGDVLGSALTQLGVEATASISDPPPPGLRVEPGDVPATLTLEWFGGCGPIAAAEHLAQVDQRVTAEDGGERITYHEPDVSHDIGLRRVLDADERRRLTARTMVRTGGPVITRHADFDRLAVPAMDDLTAAERQVYHWLHARPQLVETGRFDEVRVYLVGLAQELARPRPPRRARRMREAIDRDIATRREDALTPWRLEGLRASTSSLARDT